MHDDERERGPDAKGVEVRKGVGEGMPPLATRVMADLERVDEYVRHRPPRETPMV